MKMIAILLIVTVALFGAFMYRIGQLSAPEKQYTIEPYTGLGSGVLAPNTIVKEDYKDPSSILGRTEGGVDILKEVK